PVSFVAEEKERLVFHDGPADRATELIHAKGRLADPVKEIARIQCIVPEIFKQRSMELIASRLGDDADLTAGTRTEFRGIVVGINAELLNVLKAALEPEGGIEFASDITGARVDDRRSLNTGKTHRVLLHCASAESDVAERSGTGILGAGCLQVQLRELAAIDRQVMDFALIHVDAQRRRT